MEWTPIAVLPNINVRDGIEGGQIALVASDDPRVDSAAAKQRTFRTFVGRFTDPFRRPIRPSVLIARGQLSDRLRRGEMLSSFRDLISLCAVIRGRSLQLKNGGSQGVTYADAFAIYPWMVSRDGKGLVGTTPAILGFDEVKTFRGQSSPEIFASELRSFEMDGPLLAELINYWNRRYFGRASDWKHVALFRSLNMAFHASRLPAGIDTRSLDLGRMLALWVSAFEILAHPKIGRSGTGSVFRLLNSVSWQDRDCRRRRFKAGEKQANVTQKSTLACWLYAQLYEARNHFLHGNPLGRRTGLVPKTNRHLLMFAAPLYRMALTGYLDLRWSEPLPPATDYDAYWSAVRKQHFTFTQYQDDVETALLTSRKKGH